MLRFRQSFLFSLFQNSLHTSILFSTFAAIKKNNLIFYTTTPLITNIYEKISNRVRTLALLCSNGADARYS